MDAWPVVGCLPTARGRLRRTFRHCCLCWAHFTRPVLVTAAWREYATCYDAKAAIEPGPLSASLLCAAPASAGVDTAASRSSWWSMFYVYAPIFAVTAGLGAEIGGVVTSIGTGWIWLVPVWGWVGRRFGLRRLLHAGYAVAGS